MSIYIDLYVKNGMNSSSIFSKKVTRSLKARIEFSTTCGFE